MAFKLGKLSPKFHPKTLKFSNYLLAGAPPPPPEKQFWEYKIDPRNIQMFGNDSIGDCTCAGIAHLLMLVTAHTGKVVIPELQDVLDFYSAVSGYDQKTGANDNGAAITDVLDRWQTVGLSGHKILAWAQIDHKNLTAIHQGIHIFGGLDVGVQLPESAQQQFPKNWELVNGSPIEEATALSEAGFGATGSNYQTWGKGDQKASNEWSAAYRDESYCVLTQDWVNNATGLAPNTLNMDALVKDLALLKN